MPILRYGPKRVYFAHIPKTAGISIYLWFMYNGWQLCNVGNKDGSLSITGSGKEIRERFGITQLQQEGNFRSLQSSIQHATFDVWSKWGTFDQAFAIIREPKARFQSAVSYQYTELLKRHKQKHSDVIFQKFREQLISRLEQDLEHKPNLFDNHFRSQQAFLGHDTELFIFEKNWQKNIASRFKLTTNIPHQNKSSLRFNLNERELEFIHHYYKDDIDWYKEQASANSPSLVC